MLMSCLRFRGGRSGASTGVAVGWSIGLLLSRVWLSGRSSSRPRGCPFSNIAHFTKCRTGWIPIFHGCVRHAPDCGERMGAGSAGVFGVFSAEVGSGGWLAGGAGGMPELRGPAAGGAPVRHNFLHQAEDHAPVLQDHPDPGPLGLLREVDAAEEEAGDQEDDAICEGFVPIRPDYPGVFRRAVRGGPRLGDFPAHLRAGQLEGDVGHLVRREIQPVLRAGQPAVPLQPVVERRRRKRRELAKDGQRRRPAADFPQGALGHPGVSLSIPKMKELMA